MLKRILNNKGFSLIELLVVVAILGILAAVAIVSLSGSTDKAKGAVAKTDVGNAATEATAYVAENGDLTGFPLSAGFTGKVTKTVDDPAAGDVTLESVAKSGCKAVVTGAGVVTISGC